MYFNEQIAWYYLKPVIRYDMQILNVRPKTDKVRVRYNNTLSQTEN